MRDPNNNAPFGSVPMSERKYGEYELYYKNPFGDVERRLKSLFGEEEDESDTEGEIEKKTDTQDL